MTTCDHPGLTLFVPEHGDTAIQCQACFGSWPLDVVPLDVLQRLTRLLVQSAAARVAEAN
jgi:hypothetical protein